MKQQLKKTLIFLAAAASLWLPAVAQAQDANPSLLDAVRADHYLPNGKYHLFGRARGSVQNIDYTVNAFTSTAAGPVLPVTHERIGFNADLRYETHFSGHGHEVHSPFDNNRTGNRKEYYGDIGADGFTVYTLNYTGHQHHPADGYDGPQGGGYPAPKGARDIYTYKINATSTKSKITPLPNDSFWQRLQRDNAQAMPNFWQRAEESGRQMTENNDKLNRWGNFMEGSRGILEAALNPFITGWEGSGAKTLTDTIGSYSGYHSAQAYFAGQELIGGKEGLSSAVEGMQNSAFAIQGLKSQAAEWARNNPNAAETLKTTGAYTGTALTFAVGSKIEITTPWGKGKVSGLDNSSIARNNMSPVDGEMAGGNKPTKHLPSTYSRPTTREELRQDLQAKGFRRTGSENAQYETWRGPDGIKIDIRPNGEVIRTQRVWRTDGIQGKYPQRQDYEGRPLPNNNHHSGYFVK